jgi:hypothetical protein
VNGSFGGGGLRVSRDPRTVASDLSAFERQLRDVPWFANLGAPHSRDREVVRIRGFDEWQGPERGYGDWFGRYPAVVREQTEADHPDRRAELSAVWERIEHRVIQDAGRRVPGFGDGDAWHGPTQCVYSAGYVAALVGWHLLLSRPLPDSVAERWSWFAAGHWPCDYADEPPGFGDESLVDVPAGRLLVL